jgi:hypothetical protein
VAGLRGAVDDGASKTGVLDPSVSVSFVFSVVEMDRRAWWGSLFRTS